MKTIVVASAKGGVTKTVTAVSVAYFLSTKGKTLIIDFDPQGQVALCFGLGPTSGVFDWLTGTRVLPDAVVQAREGDSAMWVLPGDSRTKAIEKKYRNLSNGDFAALVAAIGKVGEWFDYVVIDTAPSGVLQEVALAAADEVVVPFRSEVQGVDGAYGTLAMLRELGSAARITLLPSDFFEHISEQARNLSDLTEQMGSQIMAPMPVVHRTAVTVAVAEGKTIWEYNGARLEPVREAYQLLCERVAGPF